MRDSGRTITFTAWLVALVCGAEVAVLGLAGGIVSAAAGTLEIGVVSAAVIWLAGSWIRKRTQSSDG